ncbi:hypothetical protein C0Q70_07219 [Pomacea canaliculata]|uniref:C-type lectin domain-containing protein n=1 Tax=Pomacea canaliculata TaxID=400727 RepID=A0A2T7PEH0_POMCA|nr:hypothetical protein C0Q70_07219 [Pomacea canaliculata]
MNVSGVETDYQTAQANCAADGGLLLILKSRDVDAPVLRDVLTAAGIFLRFSIFSVWVGADDISTEGSFVWNDGSPLLTSSSLWNTGEPNNVGGNEDCVQMHISRDLLILNDNNCGKNNTKDRLVYPVMAEWVSDQSFDNIVLYPNEMVELPPTSKVVWSLADEDMTSGQCAEECMKEEWCSSFFVDFSKNLCLLHEVVFFTPDTGGRKVSAPGARSGNSDAAPAVICFPGRCNLSKGLYRWREEDLCFKLLPPGTIKQGPSEDADAYCRDKLGGSLIKLSTIRRTEWIRKILLQWHSSSTGNLTTCAEKCIQVPECSSFFVDIQGKECILHEIIFLSSDAGNQTVVADGARYFKRSEDYNYARFRDQTLRPHMCRIPVQNDIQVGSELDCLYLKDDSLLRQEENYNIFCEVF